MIRYEVKYVTRTVRGKKVRYEATERYKWKDGGWVKLFTPKRKVGQ